MFELRFVHWWEWCGCDYVISATLICWAGLQACACIQHGHERGVGRRLSNGALLVAVMATIIQRACSLCTICDTSCNPSWVELYPSTNMLNSWCAQSMHVQISIGIWLPHVPTHYDIYIVALWLFVTVCCILCRDPAATV